MSTSDGEYEWNAKQDWEAFKQEVKDLYDQNPEYTIRDVARIVGGDFEDVKYILLGGD